MGNISSLIFTDMLWEYCHMDIIPHADHRGGINRTPRITQHASSRNHISVSALHMRRHLYFLVSSSQYIPPPLGAHKVCFPRYMADWRSHWVCSLVYGPDRPPVHPPQERMRPILFCSWDLSEHEKWMPPSPNWDGLPVGRHFQNGRHRN